MISLSSFAWDKDRRRGEDGGRQRVEDTVWVTSHQRSKVAYYMTSGRNKTWIPQHLKQSDFGTWSGLINIVICGRFLFHLFLRHLSIKKVHLAHILRCFVGGKVYSTQQNQQSMDPNNPEGGNKRTPKAAGCFYNQIQSELPMNSNWFSK